MLDVNHTVRITLDENTSHTQEES